MKLWDFLTGKSRRLRKRGWKPITERIIVQPGETVFWIERGDWYKIIPPPDDLPWPEIGCYSASAGVVPARPLRYEAYRTVCVYGCTTPCRFCAKLASRCTYPACECAISWGGPGPVPKTVCPRGSTSA